MGDANPSSDSAPVDVVELPLARVHPDFQGLTLVQLRGALLAELRLGSEEQLIEASWALGGPTASRAEPSVALPQEGDLGLVPFDKPRLVSELHQQVEDLDHHKQLPLIGLLKSRKE